MVGIVVGRPASPNQKKHPSRALLGGAGLVANLVNLLFYFFVFVLLN